jgi:ferrochelatase
VKTGVLLLNLGTPDDASPEKVRDYLEEFLMDADVIDIAYPFRWILVKQIILRTRPKKSAEAYAKIWTERGSPLRFHSLDFLHKVANKVLNVSVKFGMRYGNPSIRAQLHEFKNESVDRLIIFPLYPQFAESSYGSCVKLCKKILKELNWNPIVNIVEPFYQKSEFIDAWGKRASPIIKEFKPDHLLFSFHGLPERHIKATDITKRFCLKSNQCCDQICEVNKNCYRAQSFATARGIASHLKMKDSDFTVSFQSRLGATPWIKPYTDLILPKLVERGFKRVAVMCPAFVADCLETLEEIGIRGKEQFLSAGGSELILIPSLNSETEWVDAAVQMIETELKRI